MTAPSISKEFENIALKITSTYSSLYGIPKTSPDVMRFTHYLDLGALGEEVEVTVEGRYTDGYPGSWEEPAEKDSFEIERVTFRGLDVFDLLTTDAQEEIITAAMDRG